MEVGRCEADSDTSGCICVHAYAAILCIQAKGGEDMKEKKGLCMDMKMMSSASLPLTSFQALASLQTKTKVPSLFLLPVPVCFSFLKDSQRHLSAQSSVRSPE